MLKNYGITKKQEAVNEVQAIVESILINGYCIINDLWAEKDLSIIRKELDLILQLQESQFSSNEIESINEKDIVRMPFVYNSIFMEIITHPLVAQVVSSCLGSYYILHLQNGIINRPSNIHHQTSWHRDLPYQDFVSSEPLGINAFLCIDEFSIQSGGTIILPFSHKIPNFPSENYVSKNQLQITAQPGSVVFFDSMLYHKAGINKADFIRRGINTMFVRPILKQQIDIPEMLQGKYSNDPKLSRILGYDSRVPKSIEEFRRRRLAKQQTV